MKKTMRMALPLLLLTLLSMLLLTGCGKSVNLKDCVSVTFSGAEGYGKASASLDDSSLVDLVDVDVDQDIGLDEIGGALNAYWYIEDIEVSLDTTEGLSNGDKVTVTIEYPEELSKAMGVGIRPKSGTSWTVEVSGLPEVEEVDPFEDVNVTFSGYDGYGAATVEDNSPYGLSYNLSNTASDLSNGDVVTLTVSTDNGSDLQDYCIENYGFVPTATSRDYTVSGLEEAQTIDLFEDLDVTVEGRSPYLSLSILGKYNNDGIYYRLEDSDQNGNLKAGDTVTIKALASGLFTNYDLNDYCLKNLGGLPASETYTYTIGADAPAYITDASQLSGAVLDALKTEAQDQFDADSKDRDLTVNSVNYYGYYLLTAKQYDNWSDYNRVYLLQEVNYTLGGETATHYNAVRFSNVFIDTDGACHFDGVKNLGDWFWDTGLESIYDFESEYITPNVADYNDVSGT